MAYVPRPFQVKTCKHCRTDFETNHKSRIYCSQSCNTLAWMKRHQVEGKSAASGKKKATLDFNAQNVATVAAGSLLADGVKELGKAVFSVKSAEERKIDLLTEEVRGLRAIVEGKGVSGSQQPAVNGLDSLVHLKPRITPAKATWYETNRRDFVMMKDNRVAVKVPVREISNGKRSLWVNDQNTMFFEAQKGKVRIVQRPT